MPNITAGHSSGPDPQLTAGRSTRRLLDGWTSRLALLGCLMTLTAGIAMALPAGASAATRGFHVYNLSGYTLRLVSTTGDFYSKPNDGDDLTPGAYSDFEVVSYFFVNNLATATYNVMVGTGVYGQLTVNMEVDNQFVSYGYIVSSCEGSWPYGQVGTCSANDTTINFLDLPGTVNNIPAGQGQAQADVLNQLCTEDSAARCTFNATNEIDIDSPTHQVGDALVNNTSVDQHTSIATTDTLTQSDSVGLTTKVQAALSKIIDISIQASYNHTWTSTHTFEQTVDVDCPAHTRCAIAAAQPMRRDTGDFTISMGNTTWHLPDVYFDTPNPDGNGSYVVNSTPLSPDEQATLPATFHSEKRASAEYSVPTTVIEQPTADAKLQVTIDGPAALTPGQTAEDQITITPTEPTARMVYPIGDLHLHTQINGQDPHDTTIANLALDEPDTVPLSFSVPAATDGRVCLTVDATADHADAGHAQYCATAP
jgi:hypothetical protein